ncbi:MAG: sulfite exporter TauE/SafE family protein [Rhodospirillales bacterium]|nr:sulfite exporter TauE/SafE family protein [Rhodospirillales bacterium]
MVVDEKGALLGSLFAAGLIGSLTHCVGMCGPFVLSQVTARLDAVPAAGMREFHRLTGAALLPYHLGRLTTYAALGAVGGSLAGGVVTTLPGLRGLSAGLLALAAVLFMGYGLQRLGLSLPRFLSGDAKTGSWSRVVSRVAGPLFGNPRGWRGFVLGLFLGFIPCGLLYGGLAAAASAGGALAGAMAMGAFGLGTIPGLFAVGLAGHLSVRRWEGLASKVAPGLMVVNALILSYMAWTLVA